MTTRPDKCPTCGSVLRDVRRWQDGPELHVCDDPWHAAPAGGLELQYTNKPEAYAPATETVTLSVDALMEIVHELKATKARVTQLEAAHKELHSYNDEIGLSGCEFCEAIERASALAAQPEEGK